MDIASAHYRFAMDEDGFLKAEAFLRQCNPSRLSADEKVYIL
jgi:hypothetical protein